MLATQASANPISTKGELTTDKDLALHPLVHNSRTNAWEKSSIDAAEFHVVRTQGVRGRPDHLQDMILEFTIPDDWWRCQLVFTSNVPEKSDLVGAAESETIRVTLLDDWNTDTIAHDPVRGVANVYAQWFKDWHFTTSADRMSNAQVLSSDTTFPETGCEPKMKFWFKVPDEGPGTWKQRDSETGSRWPHWMKMSKGYFAVQRLYPLVDLSPARSS